MSEYEVIYETHGAWAFTRVAVPLAEKPGQRLPMETRQLADGRWTYSLSTTRTKPVGGSWFGETVYVEPTPDQLFATRDEAADAGAAIYWHGAQYREGVMTRARYEQECVALSITPESDRDLRYWDGGSYSVAEYGAKYLPALLNTARGAAVRREAEEAKHATRTASLTPPAMIECPACGAWTRTELLMSASVGTACPACYDDAEDGRYQR